ncbi:hypothetical protein C8R46DRAFT_1035498 [Mycena filopes]|nr:hypothetical protein C8R46DRAFT_1035498 [Mycena filopes]
MSFASERRIFAILQRRCSFPLRRLSIGVETWRGDLGCSGRRQIIARALAGGGGGAARQDDGPRTQQARSGAGCSERSRAAWAQYKHKRWRGAGGSHSKEAEKGARRDLQYCIEDAVCVVDGAGDWARREIRERGRYDRTPTESAGEREVTTAHEECCGAGVGVMGAVEREGGRHRGGEGERLWVTRVESLMYLKPRRGRRGSRTVAAREAASGSKSSYMGEWGTFTSGLGVMRGHTLNEPNTIDWQTKVSIRGRALGERTRHETSPSVPHKVNSAYGDRDRTAVDEFEDRERRGCDVDEFGTSPWIDNYSGVVVVKENNLGGANVRGIRTRNSRKEPETDIVSPPCRMSLVRVKSRSGGGGSIIRGGGKSLTRL